MALLIYNTAIFLYTLGLKFAALFNNKAGALIKGRKNWKKILSAAVAQEGYWIWMHCASLGEFEQGRPLLEEIKKRHPQYKFLVTFFSPSGYTVRKNYEYADAVLYMPSDTKANAEFFIEKLKPVLAIFVKYEFWYHHLNQLYINNIKCILISATFSKEQSFFKWYGGIFRKLLNNFTAIFVQDQESVILLKNIGIKENVFVTGDTRYDRVAEIADKAQRIPGVENFLAGSKSLIAGSTWASDEKIIKESLSAIPDDWKLIIAPHEISQDRLKYIEELFGDEIFFFSQLKTNTGVTTKKILVIDNIGMLSSLYAYGTIAYVGGGFQKRRIHNILEPAIFGLPVIFFGQENKKSVEANELSRMGFAFPLSNADQCRRVLNKLVNDEQECLRLSHSIKKYIRTKTGATHKIILKIKQCKWI